jgi:hypothetical protein
MGGNQEIIQGRPNGFLWAKKKNQGCYPPLSEKELIGSSKEASLRKAAAGLAISLTGSSNWFGNAHRKPTPFPLKPLQLQKLLF